MDETNNQSDSLLKQMKDNSLKTAGYAYLLGDASLAASGILAGRYKEASSGVLWWLGGLACARYGNPTAETQLELLSNRLGRHLRKQGIDIPDTQETKPFLKNDSALTHIEDFLYTYPSQILNTTFVIGGLQLLRSGLQHGKRWDAASGALVTGGGLGGLFIKEKQPDATHPSNGIIGWIQEKPLRLSGTLYALNNITLTMSALQERAANPAQKSYLFKFLTAGSYLFGNAMLSMSSKTHADNAKDNNAALDKLAARAATIIAAQPEGLREELTHHIAAFLSAQPEVHMSAGDITERLQKKLPQERSTMSWQQRVRQHSTQEHSPTL